MPLEKPAMINSTSHLLRWALCIPGIVALTIVLTTLLGLDTLGSENVLAVLFAVYAISWACFARRTSNSE